MSTGAFDALRAIERKLERWELQHLREHAAQLAAQAEDLEARLQVLQRQLDSAEDAADYWRVQVMQLQGSLADDVALGLAQDGSLSLVRAPSTFAESSLDAAETDNQVVDGEQHCGPVDQAHAGVGAVGGAHVAIEGLPTHGSAQGSNTLGEQSVEVVDGLTW